MLLVLRQNDVIAAYDVAGDVQVRDAQGAVTSTCTWSVDRVAFNQGNQQNYAWQGSTADFTPYSWTSAEQLAAPGRTGFRISPDCALQSSAFLPGLLTLRDHAVFVAGPLVGTRHLTFDLWYDGPIVSRDSTSSNSGETSHRTSWFTKSPVSNGVP